MKTIVRKKQFDNSIKLIIQNRPNIKKKIIERINEFLIDRHSSKLRDHALKGKMNGIRAFSITGDLRIIYEETEVHFVFLDIGTHNQIY